MNAAKLRKDLSHLGSYGTRGVGYEVINLTHEIRRELGLDEQSPVIVVGLGNLGQALAKHGGFGDRGFPIVALFDVQPDIVGMQVGDPVPLSLSSDIPQREAECPNLWTGSISLRHDHSRPLSVSHSSMPTGFSASVRRSLGHPHWCRQSKRATQVSLTASIPRTCSLG